MRDGFVLVSKFYVHITKFRLAKSISFLNFLEQSCSRYKPKLKEIQDPSLTPSFIESRPANVAHPFYHVMVRVVEFVLKYLQISHFESRRSERDLKENFGYGFRATRTGIRAVTKKTQDQSLTFD